MESKIQPILLKCCDQSINIEFIKRKGVVFLSPESKLKYEQHHDICLRNQAKEMCEWKNKLLEDVSPAGK